MSDDEQQALLPGLTEEAKQAVQVGDRQRNTLATPEYLASITTCCVCSNPLPAGRRYLCDAHIDAPDECPLDTDDSPHPEGRCEGCGGTWLMGKHFHPIEIADAMTAAEPGACDALYEMDDELRRRCEFV